MSSIDAQVQLVKILRLQVWFVVAGNQQGRARIQSISILVIEVVRRLQRNHSDIFQSLPQCRSRLVLIAQSWSILENRN